MCILSYLPPNVPVDEDGLFNGGLSNPDGHGWAIADGGTILMGKSLDLVEALDDFQAARAKHLGGHALFHSRWATHGKITTDNVHPFYVGGSDRTVVGHNGILPASAWPTKGDDRSDTRVFADDILSTRYRRLNRDRVREALANWIGSGNKLVILTVDPRYRQNAYLINEHLGTWDKTTGIWHSNHDYETAPWWMYGKGKTSGTSKTYTYRNGKLEIEDYLSASAAERCYLCDGWVNQRTLYCNACGCCQDCLEDKRDCFCYSRYGKALAPSIAAETDDDRAEREAWEDTAITGWDDDDVPMIGRTTEGDYA